MFPSLWIGCVGLISRKAVVHDLVRCIIVLRKERSIRSFGSWKKRWRAPTSVRGVQAQMERACCRSDGRPASITWEFAVIFASVLCLLTQCLRMLFAALTASRNYWAQQWNGLCNSRQSHGPTQAQDSECCFSATLKRPWEQTHSRTCISWKPSPHIGTDKRLVPMLASIACPISTGAYPRPDSLGRYYHPSECVWLAWFQHQ